MMDMPLDENPALYKKMFKIHVMMMKNWDCKNLTSLIC